MSTTVTAADLVWLGSLARRLAGTDAAEDLVQDTFVAAGERADRGWLAGVLKNRWRMRARSQQRRRARELAASPPQPAASPEAALLRGQVVELLFDALAQLPASDRKLVVLRYCEGLTSGEIGEQLDISPATVRTRLARSLARLRRDLGQRWGERDPSWQLAVGMGPALAGANTAAGGISVAVLMKGLGAAAVAGIVATSAWVAWPPPTTTPVEPNAQLAPAPAGLAPAPTADERPSVATAPRERRRAWKQKRDRVRRAQAEREAVAEGPAPTLRDVETARELVATLFGEKSDALRIVFEELQEQLTTSFLDCLGEDHSGAGQVRARATLIGEPDIGVVVEAVEIQEDTVGDPELAECVRESVYGFDLSVAPRPITGDVYDFTLDLDQGSIEAGVPLGRMFEAYRQYPELIAELETRLRENPGLADVLLAELAKTDDIPALSEMLRGATQP